MSFCKIKSYYVGDFCHYDQLTLNTANRLPDSKFESNITSVLLCISPLVVVSSLRIYLTICYILDNGSE
jgi:hypothetical protein